MLCVTDSLFQAELMRQAKDAGKLPKGYEIPAAHRENFPDRIAAALKPSRDAGLLPAFPFGSDFTDVEQRLIRPCRFSRKPPPASSACLSLRGMAFVPVRRMRTRLPVSRDCN